MNKKDEDIEEDISFFDVNKFKCNSPDGFGNYSNITNDIDKTLFKESIYQGTQVNCDNKRKFDNITIQRKNWSFLKWNPPGTDDSYKKAVNTASKYLNKVIIPYLLERNIIIKGQSPSLTILEENGHKDFTSALYHYKVSYNKVLKKSGFKLNRCIAFWNFLNWDEDGIPRTKEEALENAKNFLLNKILTNEIKNELGLRNNDAPTRKVLVNAGFHDFFSALYKRKLKYNDVIRKSGLKINRDLDKYSFLNWNSTGNPRTKEKALKNAANYLLEKIITEKFKQKYNLGHGEGPASYLNEKKFHNFLWRGLYARGLFYNDVLERAALVPHDQAILANVGKNFHWIGERILLQYTRNNSCLAFYEIYPSKYSSQFNQNHSDFGVIVDRNLRKLIKYNQKITDDIKIIIIDFFMGTSETYVIDHCLKGYQDKYKFLILVPINAKREIYTPENIPHRNHVKILDPVNLLKFIGIEGTLYDEFLCSVEIAKKATYNSYYRKQLKILTEKSKSIIKSIYDYGQMDLENCLKNKKDLLSYNPDQFQLDYFFK